MHENLSPRALKKSPNLVTPIVTSFRHVKHIQKLFLHVERVTLRSCTGVSERGIPLGLLPTPHFRKAFEVVVAEQLLRHYGEEDEDPYRPKMA